MDIDLVKRLLAGRHSRQTRWEFINFIIEPYGEFRGRAVLAVLARLREIDSLRANTVEQTILSDLEAEADQLNNWIDQYSQEEIEKLLATVEENEEGYWAQRLGREAAVDLLSQGRVSKETMSRAVLLSEDAYRVFAETCGSIAHVVNSISQEVEREQNFAASLPENMGK